MSDAEEDKYLLQLLDYLKYLTTVSTGAIVLIATFLRTAALDQPSGISVKIAVVGFIAQILGAVVAYTLVLIFVYRGRSESTAAALFGLLGFAVAWIGFLVGIVSLGVFAISVV